MKRILAIGNSFSQDATALLGLITDELYVRNLYIGGCSLERHCRNIRENKREYCYEENGAKCVCELVGIEQALKDGAWDYVAVQQVSGLSGIEDSFYPYLPELTAYIKRYTSAEIVLHRTWAYETDSSHPDFARYGNNQIAMWNAIENAYDSVAEREGLRIIDVGRAIQDLRSRPVFDYAKGGLSLNRDGFHLSLNYGRFVAAAVWCEFFTGEYPRITSNSPAFATVRDYFANRKK